MRRRINTARKGTDIERKAILLLRGEGYDVHRTIRTRYRTKAGWGSHRNDIFGCVDLVAKRSGERTRWIQVHAGSGISAKAEELRRIQWTLAHDSVEIWRWVDGRTGVHPRTGQPLPNHCFLLYRMDNDFEHDKSDFIRPTAKGEPSAPGT